MWYLIVIFIILGIIILLPIFRYRKFWKTALKDSELKYHDSIKMLINHVKVCLVPNKHDYRSYIEELKNYVDESDTFLWVCIILFLIAVWPGTILVSGIILLVILIAELLKNSINKKRL